MLATLIRFVKDQKTRSRVNNNQRSANAYGPRRSTSYFSRGSVALGRYPEDEYNGHESTRKGGSPGFVCTNAIAEILYHIAEHLLLT